MRLRFTKVQNDAPAGEELFLVIIMSSSASLRLVGNRMSSRVKCRSTTSSRYAMNHAIFLELGLFSQLVTCWGLPSVLDNDPSASPLDDGAIIGPVVLALRNTIQHTSSQKVFGLDKIFFVLTGRATKCIMRELNGGIQSQLLFKQVHWLEEFINGRGGCVCCNDATLRRHKKSGLLLSKNRRWRLRYHQPASRRHGAS
jgi:hypothetical protein